jgi:hypothetical protein
MYILMFESETFDITLSTAPCAPNSPSGASNDHKIPEIASWGRSAVQLSISDQYTAYLESLRRLECDYHIKSKLNPANIYDMVWNNELLDHVMNFSFPLRKLIKGLGGPTDRNWLVYWELYSRFLFRHLVASTKDRPTARPDKRIPSTTVHTFHIHDVHGLSINSMGSIINRVEAETEVRIKWDWLASHQSDMQKYMYVIKRNPDRWVHGVDGTDEINISNMRAWRNRIITGLKHIDIIISNNDTEDDKINEISFTLINLAKGGAAIIYLPRISSTSIVAIIHLFSMCFGAAAILHTVSNDRLYLCGSNFLDNLSARHRKLLYEFCESRPEISNQSPFTLEYIRGAAFTETLEKLLDLNAIIYEWRLDAYEKLLTIYSRLCRSSSCKLFNNRIDEHLNDQYSDESDKWVEETEFNLYGKKIEYSMSAT